MPLWDPLRGDPRFENVVALAPTTDVTMQRSTLVTLGDSNLLLVQILSAMSEGLYSFPD